MARLGFFPPSCPMTRNKTHDSSVATPQETLIDDPLPVDLPRPRYEYEFNLALNYLRILRNPFVLKLNFKLLQSIGAIKQI